MRGPLSNDGYRPQFSGHETFPLRYGWLKKVYDQIQVHRKDTESKKVFLDDAAIARFGVGKNMVASMRHWATATDIIHEKKSSPQIVTTNFGRLILDDNGLDPFMEHPATLWLMHWKLTASPQKTTWFWTFNHFSAPTFHRDQLIKGLMRLSKERGWARVAATTVKNDVACFIRTYVPYTANAKAKNDGTLESPLTELGLIKPIGKADGFRFVRGPKSTLGDGVFTYCLLDFWARHSSATATLSFEAIAHEPGGPGRVFLLDENDVADKLVNLEVVTKGKLLWSETAGLKQVVRESVLDHDSIYSYISHDYPNIEMRKSA